jgi:hypothetical protein
MAERARNQMTYYLCRSVLRNAAFFRGGISPASTPKTQFAIQARNNFLDMVFLDWCKLFWDRRGPHHFAKILPDVAGFSGQLLAAVKMSAGEFEGVAKSVAHYRDKALAHTDVFDTIDIPRLDAIIESTLQLYEALRAQCGDEPEPRAPYDLRATLLLEEDVGRSNFVAMASVAQ